MEFSLMRWYTCIFLLVLLTFATSENEFQNLLTVEHYIFLLVPFSPLFLHVRVWVRPFRPSHCWATWSTIGTSQGPTWFWYPSPHCTTGWMSLSAGCPPLELCASLVTGKKEWALFTFLYTLGYWMLWLGNVLSVCVCRKDLGNTEKLFKFTSSSLTMLSFISSNFQLFYWSSCFLECIHPWYTVARGVGCVCDLLWDAHYWTCRLQEVQLEIPGHRWGP